MSVESVLAWNDGTVAKGVAMMRREPEDSGRPYILCDAVEEAGGETEDVVRFYATPPEWVEEAADQPPNLPESIKQDFQSRCRRNMKPRFVGWRGSGDVQHNGNTAVGYCACDRVADDAHWRDAMPKSLDTAKFQPVCLVIQNLHGPTRDYPVYMSNCPNCGRWLWAAAEGCCVVEPVEDDSLRPLLAAWVESRVDREKASRIRLWEMVEVRPDAFRVQLPTVQYGPTRSTSSARRALKRAVLAELNGVANLRTPEKRCYVVTVHHKKQEIFSGPMPIDAMYVGGHFMIGGQQVEHDLQRPVHFRKVKDGEAYWSQTILPADLIPAEPSAMGEIERLGRLYDMSL